MIVQKIKAEYTGQMSAMSDAKSCKIAQVTKGYTYYAFITKEKSWIKHSKQLTNEEKQYVIKHESK